MGAYCHTASIMKGNQLKAVRALLGVSQEKFAVMVGVSESTIQRFERMKGEIEGCHLRSFNRIMRAIENQGFILKGDGIIVNKDGEIS